MGLGDHDSNNVNNNDNNQIIIWANAKLFQKSFVMTLVENMLTNVMDEKN